MGGSLKDQVVLLTLTKIKEAVGAGRVYFVSRKKNQEALASMGLCVADVTDIILGLTPECYRKGPEDDEDGSSGEVWVFERDANPDRIYIKIKLLKRGVGWCIKILSFHS
ncbi:MAG: type II toxin-antitoxin system MqsR family toxin [Spirochaetaceae bacterium]|nr:type II toxin-antitoxin system MqsR family toxin [Spirochaetaceae bacterium]